VTLETEVFCPMTRASGYISQYHMTLNIFKHLADIVWRCMLGLAPAYLLELCILPL